MCGNERNRQCLVAIAAVVVCLASGLPQAGADWGEPTPFVVERQKVIASDGSAGDHFGIRVSIIGDWAIVGAQGDDGYGSSAYMFRWAGTNWAEQQKLIPLDGSAGDHFGFSVSVSGDYAVAGAYSGDANETDSGAAYVFMWDGMNWVEQAKLMASDGVAGDRFGMSVSISGDYAIVGAYEDDFSKGSAYVFKRDGTGWSQQQKLTASDGVMGDHFGYSVSISGDYAVVGADGDDGNRGSAYIFKRDGTGWAQQQKRTAIDGIAGDCFGWSVSIDGDYVIVGAWGDDGYSGSAYIFKRNGTTWPKQAKIVASDGDASDSFGEAVSISGEYAIVGAYGDDGGKGSVYMFKRDGTSWAEQQKLLASDGTTGDYFGVSVSISGDRAIVGAHYGDGNMIDSGSAYAFRFCPIGDLNDDCRVDFTDFAGFANWWRYGTD